MDDFLIIVAIILVLVFVFFGGEYEPRGVYEELNIRSISFQQDTIMEGKGFFVIGLGKSDISANTETFYWLYVELGDGYILRKINAENLVIVETDSVEPKIEGNFLEDNKISKNETYTVYVPIGTKYEPYDNNER